MAILLGVACAPAVPASAPVQPAATAATPKAAPAAQPSFPVTITDDAGRQVTVEREPQRIVSMAPSNTEILFAIGLGDKVVGVDQYSDYPPEALTREKIAGYATPNLEKVLSLAPDLVLATKIHAKTAVPSLEGHGLTVVVVDPANMDEVLEGILMVGKIGGGAAKAKALTGQIEERMRTIMAKAQASPRKVRVFFELSPQLHSVGPGSFIDDMIRRASGENIASDAKLPWPQLNQEVVLLKDPEVIVLSDHTAGESPEKVKARPGWAGVAAVKNDRVVTINPDLTNRPGPRVVEGLEALARAFYPEIFK